MPLGDGDVGSCSEGLLRPSVIRVLYCAWSDTRSAVATWMSDRDLGRADRIAEEAVLTAWLQEDSASAFRTDLCYCLAGGEEYSAPHMTNLSVTLQEEVLHEAGDDRPWVVLHWISSIAFLLICGSNVPVCSAFWAWRFGCVHPLLLENRDVRLDYDMAAECWTFWRVLGRIDERLGRHLAESLRVHVVPVTRAVDHLFPTLAGALLHPHTALSLHVSEQGDGPMAKRLRWSLGSTAVLPVLQKASVWETHPAQRLGVPARLQEVARADC